MAVDYVVARIEDEEEETCERCGKVIKDGKTCTLSLDCWEGKKLYYLPEEESKEVVVILCEECATKISKIIKQWLKERD